jgi:hypothetical protein
MILVAATGLGLALAKNIIGDALLLPTSPMWVSRPITYFMLAWSLAFLPIRLRRPRPSRRLMLTQPGMAACGAVALITMIDAFFWVSYWTRIDQNPSTAMLQNYWRVNSHHLGTAVGLTWSGLILSRRWRPEPNWIDRLGRFLGCLWLLTLLCDWRFGRWTFNLTYRLATSS